MTKISIIVPCYFNGKNIPITVNRLIKNEALFESGVEFQYVFVDDGSKDNTFKELENFYQKNPAKVRVIKLTRNFGSHQAVLAGLKFADGHCHVVLSADLQDPPELIPRMYDYWKKGAKLVVANHIGSHESFYSKAL